MFLMIGINEHRKKLDFSQLIICDACGAYGSLSVYMTYTALSLFLIPVFRWNRKYWAGSSCCDMAYSLDAEIGARIARGEKVEILPEHLTIVAGQSNTAHRCANCGFVTWEDYCFCPKCGKKF